MLQKFYVFGSHQVTSIEFFTYSSFFWVLNMTQFAYENRYEPNECGERTFKKKLNQKTFRTLITLFTHKRKKMVIRQKLLSTSSSPCQLLTPMKNNVKVISGAQGIILEIQRNVITMLGGFPRPIIFCVHCALWCLCLVEDLKLHEKSDVSS